MNNTSIDRNIYDVTTYSDKELLDILDLINPSDRELEAKLILYIRKYDNIDSLSAKLLSKFYHDIYYHFFEVDEDNECKEENENEKVENEHENKFGFNTLFGFGKEGFDNSQTFQSNLITEDPTSNNNLSKGILSSNDLSFSSPSTPSIVPIGNQIQLTSTLDYTKGKLNPLLKQTYKRTICIDSQYRDSINTLATDFTLNFTETLKDVVSLKLYAIQIPYTWYTISRNYGSNFIFLKGNSPGINNGYHDFQIRIDPGNYQIDTIGTAIQNSIQKLSTTYTDISFGTTNLLYNKTGCTATFVIDIQMAFNETNYRFYFSDNFYSPMNTSNIPNKYRTTHLSTFLGFNYPDYSCSSIYSSRNVQINSSDSLYTFDNSNNIIYLIQYAPIKNSSGQISDFNSNCYIYQTIPIIFPILNGLYSQTYILNTVQNTINSLQQSKSNLIIQSSVELININNVDITGNTINGNGNYYFQWNFKLNRFAGSNYPGSKLCLVLPSIETNMNNPIWIGLNSCFHFTSIYNELNHIISETNVSTSSFDISGNIYYEFICSDPLYNIGGVNNISSGTIINNSNYSLNDYISAIDYRFNVMNENLFIKNGNSNVFIRNYSFAEISDDSTFHIQMDIGRFFYTNNFRIDFSGIFINLLQFSTTTINNSIPLYDGITFTTQFQQLSNYFISSSNNLLMTVYPDGKFGGTNSSNNGFSNDISYNIYIPSGNYSGFIELQEGINSTFRSYSDNIGSYPLFYSSVLITQIGNNQLNCVLTLNIKKQLSQLNYILYFYDFGIKNTWNTNLGLKDVSYNLLNYTGNNYALVSGSIQVETDIIDLRLGGIANQFYLSPLDQGVIGSGDLIFTIPPAKYTRSTLFNTINNLLNANPITTGSYFNYIIDPITKIEYTKIIWNINKVYTSNDYKLVFYDLFSFVSCYLGDTSVRNATWDTTLGWIMGFRNLTQYSLVSTNIYYNKNLDQYFFYDPITDIITNNNYSIDNTSNPYRAIVRLTADTTVSVNLYNYFMVILDDYNQNHLNDGLVTITPKDNSLKLPSYANRALYICDPITGKRTNTGITDNGNNNLTQNQIYSINQIISAQNTAKSYTNSGVYVKDIFGLIPIKTTGMTPGQIYVELGGTLQNQDRIYFGPVNIHRMAIKLVNDRGDVVDLNGANWSLQFICEQLYQSASSNSGSSS